MSASKEHLTLQLYERWAESYPPVPHNPLMRAEQEAMWALCPPLSGRRVLDLACGSGRYARLAAAAGAASVLALDRSPQMLRQVVRATAVQGSMLQLPFANARFDVVLCGLAVGHAQDLEGWMGQVARILAARGTLVYSDFHPRAAAAGHTRQFCDSKGEVHAVPHHQHTLAAHVRAAAAVGLTVETVRQVRVGFELRETFPGSPEFYRRWHGLPVALVVRVCKCA